MNYTWCCPRCDAIFIGITIPGAKLIAVTCPNCSSVHQVWAPQEN